MCGLGRGNLERTMSMIIVGFSEKGQFTHPMLLEGAFGPL